MPSVMWDSSHSHGLFRIPTPQMKESLHLPYQDHLQILSAHFGPTIVVGRFVVDVPGSGWSDLPRPPETESAATNVKALDAIAKEPRREET